MYFFLDLKGRNISGDSSGDEDSDEEYVANRNDGTPDQVTIDNLL